jgi:formylmethanofuran dehydrogenase subunit C
MGNGTTAVVAKGNWRHFVGFEINQQLKPIIDGETGKITPGQMYRPYTERLPSTETLGNLYPRAYREYLKAEKVSKG